MKLKHTSALAFRVLAVYIGFVAIQYMSSTAQMITPAMRFATRRNFPSWPNFAVPGFMYIVGAVVLFFYSLKLAPKSDEEEDGSLTFEQLKGLSFLVLGAFFLINGVPLAITDLFSTLRPDLFNRQPGLDRWIYDVGSSNAGIGLIVANSPKREVVPGFDEMRSQTRKSAIGDGN